ncbi:MAG: TolC family protein [Cyanobacteria bacterium P01_F01_bin.42]
MSPRKLVWMIAACGLGSFSLVAASPDAIAQKTSPETQKLRQQLVPTTPPPFGSGDAADLAPLDPDPILLDLPKDESDVEIDITQPISLDQALTLARRNNREIQQAELDIKAAQARLDEAKSDKLPDVAVTGQLTRTQDFIDIVGSDSDAFPAGSNSVSATVQAQYDVFTNGQRPAAIRAALEDLEANSLELRVQLWELRLDVANDYFDLQQSDELIKISESAVENARDSFENTVALEQAGLGTRFDVLRAEVQLADRQQQLTQSIASKQIAQRQLAERLSLNDNAMVTALDSVNETGRWPLTLDQSIVSAQRFRAELAEVLNEREIAVLNEKIAKRSVGPFLSVSGSLSGGANLQDSAPTAGFDPVTGAPITGDALTSDVGYAVGAEATYTIFDGGLSKAQARQQAISTQIADTQFANTKNVIRFQIEQNFYNMTSSLQNISTNRKAVEQAEQSLELAKLRFREGIGTQLEVSNEETSLTRAESNLLQAIIDYNRALIGLQRSVADPNLELLPFSAPTASVSNRRS